jgi:hypothetical protein
MQRLAIIEKYSQEIKTTVDTILNESPDDVEYAALGQPEPQQDAPSEGEQQGSGMLELDLSGLEELARSSVEEAST